MSDLATATPIDRLIDNLAQSGFDADPNVRDELKQRFRKTLYKFIPSFPCPSYTGTNPFQPVPGQGITYNFTPDVVPFDYTLVVMDVSVTPPVIVFQTTIQFAAPPYQFNIPAITGGANTFIDGHDYVFVLYPSVRAGATIVPFGCVSSVAKTVTATAFTKAVFTALELPPSFPC